MVVATCWAVDEKKSTPGSFVVEAGEKRLVFEFPAGCVCVRGFPPRGQWQDITRRAAPGYSSRRLHFDCLEAGAGIGIIHLRANSRGEERPLNVSALLLAPWWRSESVSRVSELRLASGLRRVSLFISQDSGKKATNLPPSDSAEKLSAGVLLFLLRPVRRRSAAPAPINSRVVAACGQRV